MEKSFSHRADSFASLLGTDIHHTKKVVIAGLGRLGFPFLQQIAIAQVGIRKPGGILCIDHDIIEERNIGVQYREKYLGKSKAEAATEDIYELNSEVRLACMKKKITKEFIPEMTEISKQTSLWCWFIDDPIVWELSDILYSICPQLMAGFSRNCSFVEVGYSFPNKTVPLTQTFGKRKRKGIKNAAALPVYTMMSAIFVSLIGITLLTGCKSKFLPTTYIEYPLHILGFRREWIFESVLKDGISMASIVVNDGR